jgi:hypothetical protein
VKPFFPEVVTPIRRRVSGGEGMRLEAVHPYGAHRLVRYRHRVTGRKDLRWEHRASDGSWQSGLRGTRLEALPLYREADISLGLAAGEPVALVESESSVDALLGAGIYATTWAGGASSPQLERLFDVLGGGNVVLIPDHDDAGLTCADRIERRFRSRGTEVAVVVPRTPGEDAQDLLQRLGPVEMKRLLEELGRPDGRRWRSEA